MPNERSIHCFLATRFHKRLVLVFHGNSNMTPERAEELKIELRHRANVVVTGERSSQEISRILQTLDIGIATTPRQVIQKSGSVAAMLEHGLKVLVIRDDWRLRGADAPAEEESSQLLSTGEFALLKTLPVRSVRPSGENAVKGVAARLLAEMSSSLKPTANYTGAPGVLE